MHSLLTDSCGPVQAAWLVLPLASITGEMIEQSSQLRFELSYKTFAHSCISLHTHLRKPSYKLHVDDLTNINEGMPGNFYRLVQHCVRAGAIGVAEHSDVWLTGAKNVGGSDWSDSASC